MKVKIIKLDEKYGVPPDNAEKEMEIIHDALDYYPEYAYDEEDKHKYIISVDGGKNYWTLPASWCEVVEEHTFETEQAISKNANFPNGILLVEDGSVDIDKLEEDGFYVISYRQGSEPPKFL